MITFRSSPRKCAKSVRQIYVISIITARGGNHPSVFIKGICPKHPYPTTVKERIIFEAHSGKEAGEGRFFLFEFYEFHLLVLGCCRWKVWMSADSS